MCGYIKEIFTLISNFLQNFECLELFFRNLDPSLFQNIILGILAIFIPFAIVLYADILNSKRQRSEFEKMVLSDEVFGVKKMFILAVLGIVFFALFSGKDIAILAKIIASVVMIFYIFLLGYPFKKILNYSEGNKLGYEIGFLKKLKLSKYIKYKNKSKSKKINRAWNSFWDKKTKYNESEFIEIFISHIDDAIKYKKFNLAKELSQTYLSNIEKRNNDLMVDKILPKVFEWNEKLHNEKELQSHKYNSKKKVQEFFLDKHFPGILNKFHSKRNHFWRWDYFRRDFFQEIIKKLLYDWRYLYLLFLSFKENIDKSIKEWDIITDKNKKDRYWKNCIVGYFTIFCPIFFDNIKKISEQNRDLEHYFPKEWKIKSDNINNRIPCIIILNKLMQWLNGKIFNKDYELSEVLNFIFPTVHSELFSAFLILYFSPDIENALEKEANFFIMNIDSMISWYGNISKEEINNMTYKKEKTQKDETIQIILNFFSHYWSKLKITLNDDNKDAWENADNKERESMLKIARKEKLEKMKTEIESDEIKKICKDDERKKLYRKEFLELIGLLIKKIKNKD